MTKIYIEVEDGLVNGVYTDSKEEFDVILCNHDDAEQEEKFPEFKFEHTNNCSELEVNREKLNCIF